MNNVTFLLKKINQKRQDFVTKKPPKKQQQNVQKQILVLCILQYSINMINLTD